ncbi:hypothetical protein, partial [Yersinia pestis]
TANCFNKSKGVFITDPKLKALLNPQPSWGFSGHKKNLPPCRFFCAYDTGTDIKNTALPRAPESPADIIAAQKNHVTGQETVIWLNYLTILAGSPFIHLEQCETVV